MSIPGNNTAISTRTTFRFVSILAISGVILTGSLAASPWAYATVQDQETPARVIRKSEKQATLAESQAERAEDRAETAEDAYERAAAAASTVSKGEANSLSDKIATLVKKVMHARNIAKQALEEAESYAEEAVQYALAAQEAHEQLQAGADIKPSDVRKIKRKAKKAQRRAAAAMRQADVKADRAERLAQRHAELTRKFMAELDEGEASDDSQGEENHVLVSGNENSLDSRIIVSDDDDNGDDENTSGGDNGNENVGGSGDWSPESFDMTLGPYDEKSGPTDNGGWTILDPPADAKVIYVSSSEGSDSNSGLSESEPVKTVAKGFSMLRDGYPDQLLLKRGDEWEEVIGTLSRSGDGPISGRSISEKMVFGAYGQGPRPVLKIGSERGISLWSSSSENTSHIAVAGIHFYAHTRDPHSPDFRSINGGTGLYSLSAGEDLLVEDCKFSYCGIVVSPYQQGNSDPKFHDIKIRRSVIHGNYSDGGHAQGIFMTEAHGILLEENVLDHNGWNEYVGAERTKFNHNTYITAYCSGLTARGNIIARGSSSGLQARPGGIIEDNLFVKNACQLNWGYLEGVSSPHPGGVTGHVKRNVFMDGDPIDPNGGGGLEAMWGIKIGNVKSGEVSNNLIVRTGGIEMAGKNNEGWVGINNLTMRDNRVTDEEHALTLFLLGFNDVSVDINLLGSASDWLKDRDGAQNRIEFGENDHDMRELIYNVGHYHAQFDGGNSLESYMKEACKQGRHNWRPLYVGTIASRWLLLRNHTELN